MQSIRLPFSIYAYTSNVHLPEIPIFNPMCRRDAHNCLDIASVCKENDATESNDRTILPSRFTEKVHLAHKTEGKIKMSS
jgi:hypothetical protein